MGLIKDSITNQKKELFMILYSIVIVAFSLVPYDKEYLVAYLFTTTVALIVIPVLFGYIVRYDDNREVTGTYMALCSGIFALAILMTIMLPENIAYIPCAAIIICGAPIVYGAVYNVIKAHDIKVDLLVSVAIVSCVAIGEYLAAAEVAIIMQIGAFLEGAIVSHANSRIAYLHNLQPTTARIVKGDHTVRISVEILKVGHIVRILPGETVPADGVVVDGTSSIDTSIITGESVPCDVKVGDRVSAGTVNMFGSIDISVDRVGDESTIARMSKLLDDADAGKSKIVRVADKWATYIVATSFAIAALTYLFTGDATRFVTVLVVFCPCALILATPTAIMAAAGNMSHHGILLKDGGAIERLASIDTVLLDKTGTLTLGELDCAGVVSADATVDYEELALLVASLESRSEHPLGKAMAATVQNHLPVQDFEYIPGKGVTGTVDGKRMAVGNYAHITENCTEGIEAVSEQVSRMVKEGYTTVYVGIDGKAVGYVALTDTLRPSSKYAVRHMWMVGLKRIMITGDSKEVASRFKDELGMDDVIWECEPADKLKIVADVDRDGNACMIGDGVNDAPALKRASVGIVMGGAGKGLSMDSADMVFMDDDLSKLPGLIRLSRKTIGTIHSGITFSLVLSAIATALAVFGFMGPVAGALVHNIGSVIVIIASAMILRYNPWMHGIHKSNRAPSSVEMDVIQGVL